MKQAALAIFVVLMFGCQVQSIEHTKASDPSTGSVVSETTVTRNRSLLIDGDTAPSSQVSSENIGLSGAALSASASIGKHKSGLMFWGAIGFSVLGVALLLFASKIPFAVSTTAITSCFAVSASLVAAMLIPSWAWGVGFLGVLVMVVVSQWATVSGWFGHSKKS